jgi:hypothetical protein
MIQALNDLYNTINTIEYFTSYRDVSQKEKGKEAIDLWAESFSAH